jgi:uncharacterized protein YlxP (DUF503 family)
MEKTSRARASPAPAALNALRATVHHMTTYVCLIEARLHFGESHDLKGKRKELHSLKAHLRQRFGAAVSETDGHDKWQRATLVCALVGDGEVGSRADHLCRFIESRCPDGCSFERELLSLDDLRNL